MLDTPDRSGVFVGGAVGAPGKVPLNGGLTVWDAIIMAGGFERETANERAVMVLRISGGVYERYRLDFATVLSGAEEQPFMLGPGDMVIVPEKRIVGVNLWIDRYINNMIPRFIWTLIPLWILDQYIQDQ